MTRSDNPERIDHVVGNNIRTQRVHCGLSQSALASKLGVTFQQVQKYEKGSNSVPTGRVRNICEALKTSPNELFSWDEPQETPHIRLSPQATRFALKLDVLGDGVMKRTIMTLLTCLVDAQSSHEENTPVAQLVRAGRS